MDEARSSGGCSAEQAEVLLNFLEVAIHTILYARAVYPQELFELRKQYNVPVRMARHPVLRDYISSLLTEDHLGHWLQRGLVDQLVLAILAPDGQPLERFVFELASLRPAAPHHSNGAQAMRNPTVGDQAGSAVQDMDSENLATIAESALRACLIRLSGCTRSLMPNQPAEQHSEPGASDLTFSVVIYMRGEGAALGPPSPAHPNATDAWVEAVGSERCEHGGSPPTQSYASSSELSVETTERHSCIIPAKEVELDPQLSLRLFATEDPTLKQEQMLLHRKPQPPQSSTAAAAAAAVAAGATTNEL